MTAACQISLFMVQRVSPPLSPSQGITFTLAGIFSFALFKDQENSSKQLRDSKHTLTTHHAAAGNVLPHTRFSGMWRCTYKTN